MTTSPTVEQRAAATEHLERAIAAINELFDRVVDPRNAREALAGAQLSNEGGDPIRDAERLLAAAGKLAVALDAVRTTARSASEHRSRSDLARDIGTRPSVLFPRAPKPTSNPDPATASPASWADRSLESGITADAVGTHRPPDASDAEAR